MLQKIQQHLSGWVLWVLVIIISLGFMLWGVENYFQGNVNPRDKSIGTVNGLNIFTSDVERAFNVIAYQLAEQNDNVLPEYLRPIIEKQAVNTVVFSKVIETLAKKLGFAYGQEEVERYLPNFDVFKENGKFSEEKFYKTIYSQGYVSAQDFIDRLRNDLISNQIRTGIFGTEVATSSEFEFWAKLSGQKRDFKYAVVPANLFIEESKIDNKKIEEQYNKHLEHFKVDEKLKLEYVELLADEVSDSIKIIQEDIEEYYEDNKKQFFTPKKWLVSHIFLKKETDNDVKNLASEIIELSNKGKSFNELAKKYSDDKLTADTGGKLHWFRAGSINKKFEEAIKNIDTVGKLSEIIETEDGIEIFKLLDVKDSNYKPLEEVSETIKGKLIEQKLKKAFQELSEDLADISYSNPDSLKEVSEKLNLEIKETVAFSKKEPGTGISNISKVIDAAYHKDVHEDNNNSLPIRLADDRIVVIRIKEKIPARTRSLNEVKNELESALKLRMSIEKVQTLVKNITENLQNENSTKKIFKKHKLKWKSVKDAARSVKDDIPKNIIKLAFSIENNSKEIKLYPNGPISQEEFGIVDVQKIIYPDLSKMDDDIKKSIRDNITGYYANIMYRLYVENLKQQSEINLKDQKS